MLVISYLYYPHQHFGAIQDLMRLPEVTLRSVGMAAIPTTITAAESGMELCCKLPYSNLAQDHHSQRLQCYSYVP